MHTVRATVLALTLGAITLGARAQDPTPPLVEMARTLPDGGALAIEINEWNAQMATCVAFFNISYDRIKGRRGSGVFEDLISVSMGWMGATHGEETVLARIDLEIDSQIAEMDGDYANFSVLMRKHFEPCNLLVETTSARLDDWYRRIGAALPAEAGGLR